MRPDSRDWLAPALVAVGALTALRILALALTPMDLFVDEAQYWLWSQDPAFGYYSKPPLVAWVIRLSTLLGGSDAPFWIRLPGPLLHMATALILGAVAARLWNGRAALFTAAGFATLPMVAVASILISTDTVMFPFLAAALWFWLRAAESRGIAAALAAGACLGLAILGKYAGVYYLAGAVLAAVFVPAMRVRPAQAGAALLACGLAVAPNLIWNAANGFSTLNHTLDNADWVRDPGARSTVGLIDPALFLLEQFGVFGPVLFGVLVGLTLAAARGVARAPVPLLLCLALPPLAVVTVQAFLADAYANWAASAYVAATVAVVPWLLARARRWLAVSFLINGAVCLALPLGAIFADRLSIGGDLLFARYLGRAEMSRAIIDTARAEGLTTVTARNRDILADLFHTGRDSNLSFRAVVDPGPAPHHYALKFPLDPAAPGDVLYATTSPTAPACIGAAPPLRQITLAEGAWAGDRVTLWRVPAGCWQG